uniref:E2F/DP family winged-helix DNA-binding domain-containing protein n=1 Tax=Fagus sylvatica TaxID=28930 RepID=A0A2N9EDZ2_FAGSY
MASDLNLRNQLIHSHSLTQNHYKNQLLPRAKPFAFVTPRIPNYSNHLPPPIPLHSHSASDAHSAAFANLALRQTNEFNNCDAQTSGQAAIPGQTKLVNDLPLKPESCTGGKHRTQSKVPKHSKSGTQKSDTEPRNGLNAANGSRYDSSLGLLTKKFISLILEAKDWHPSSERDRKRTAGIGLIEKISKNHIRWKGYDKMGLQELDDQVAMLKAENVRLYLEEYSLDDSIRQRQELLRALEEDENYQKYLFLTEADIVSLPCFQNKTLIAIKAPRGSNIEVPEPNEDVVGFLLRQYRMIIRSIIGPIDLYLLSHVVDVSSKYNCQHEDMSVKQAKSLDLSASSGHCSVEDAGQSLEHQSNQNKYSEGFSSQATDVSGIQKITPPDSSILKSALQICGGAISISYYLFNKFQFLEFLDVIMQVEQFEDLSL